MNDGCVREECAKHLGLRDVPEGIWAELDATGLVSATGKAAEDPEDALDCLKEMAARYYGFYKAGAMSALEARPASGAKGAGIEQGRNYLAAAYPTNATTYEHHFDAYELRRAAAVSDALACLAARMPEVRFFREQVLGGKLLTPNLAEAFVVSPANRFLPLDRFLHWGIPILTHQACLTDWSADWIPLPRLEQLDEDSTLIYFSVQDDQLWHFQYRAKVWFEPLGPWIETKIVVVRPDDLPAAPLVPQWAIRAGRDPFPAIFPSTPVDTLRLLSKVLARHLPWEVGDAARFILTGDRPFVPPLRLGSRPGPSVIARDGVNYARTKPLGEVVLTAEAWVSDKTVRETYRALQKRSLKDKDNRPLQERSLEVFAFVFRNWPDAEPEPDWTDLLHLWNAYSPPGWHLREPWELQRAFTRAEEKLLPGSALTMRTGPLFSRLYCDE